MRLFPMRLPHLLRSSRQLPLRSTHPHGFLGRSSRRFWVLPLLGWVGALGVACTAAGPEADSVAETAESGDVAVDTADSTEGAADRLESMLSLQVIRGSEDNGNLVASVLIEGPTELLLVDGQAKLSEAEKIVEAIAETDKPLKAIWVTHAHADHYFGLSAVLEAFPETPVYSTPEVVALVEERTPNYLQIFQERFPEDAPEVPVLPTAYGEDTLEVDGESIEILSFGRGDTENVTVLHIPSLKAVIPGDIVYSGVHMYLREAPTPEDRMAWLETLETIAALEPEVIVPGHQSPDYADANTDAIAASQQYIADFNQAVSDNDGVEGAKTAMINLYPDYKYPFLLEAALKAAYGE